MTTPVRIDFDTPWKESIEEDLSDFFAFFFPQAHVEIDWNRPPVFLDTELQQVVRDAELGRRLADRLVRVWLLDGQDVWVLVHIEVQSQEEAGFAKRMWVYFYRIFDRHERQVVSLAVLADERVSWRPNTFEMSRWGCTNFFCYPVVKLLDWRDRRADLEASDNPFATVVLAHLAAQDTRRDMPGRQQIKLALIRRLYERGYARERVLSLFRFIDWLLALPAELEAQVQQAIQTIEEERNMPYVTSIERAGIEKGRTEGLEAGRTEGLEAGRTEGKRAALRRLVLARFAVLPAALDQRITEADEATLDQLLDQVVVVSTVDEL